MMKFKHVNWEKGFDLTPQKISVLAIENTSKLWQFTSELLNQASGEPGNFIISKDFAEQTFDKLCNVETNIPGITINTKKLQMALLKKCVEHAESPEFEEQLRKTSLQLYDFCQLICSDVGYSIELSENIDTAGLFKLFSLALKDKFTSLLDKLIEYVNVNVEFVKAKVFIFLFLTKFLTQEELARLVKHCQYQEVSLILIEEAFPCFFTQSIIEYQGLIIDKDDCEITKNFLIN